MSSSPFPKKRWIVSPRKNGVSVCDHLISLRELKNETVFFSPDFTRDLHDPHLIDGMATAVARVSQAIAANESILIFGDYDCDGVCGAAILYEAIKKIGGRVTFRLPHRVRDGYGLSEAAVREAAREGIKLIVTVDCGVSNFDEIALARELGLGVVIIDHHAPPANLPNADVILLPRRSDDPYPEKNLAAVGVAWKFISVLLEKYLSPEETKYYLMWALDIVALATIADCAPLRGENRLLV